MCINGILNCLCVVCLMCHEPEVGRMGAFVHSGDMTVT